MEFLKNNPKWIRQPKQVQISEDKVVILTERGTDLWARTYYGFQNDNAPVFQVETTDKYFSFIVKTEFESTCRFDQCGVAMYLNSDNWFKASIEYENKKIQRLGSVVTNHGYSDWATTDISSDIKSMWYRFSRRDSDYCIECSEDAPSFTVLPNSPRFPDAKAFIRSVNETDVFLFPSSPKNRFKYCSSCSSSSEIPISRTACPNSDSSEDSVPLPTTSFSSKARTVTMLPLPLIHRAIKKTASFIPMRPYFTVFFPGAIAALLP